MGIYIILLVCTIVSSFVGNRRQRNFLSFLVILGMLFVCGLRGRTVGADTENYINAYLHGAGRFEPMFQFTMDICHLLFLSSQDFLIVVAFITFIPLFIFLQQESKNTGFSLLIFLSFSVYFYPETFNTVRVCLSIVYMLFAYKYLSEIKLWKAIIFLVIGVLFHYSAIVIIPFLILARYIKKISFQVVLSLVVISFAFGIFFAVGFSDYASQVLALSMAFDNDMVSYYQTHLQNFEDSTLNIFGYLGDMLPFSLFVLLLYDRKNSTSLYYKLFLFAVLLTNVFISVQLAYRVTMFMLTTIIVVLPNTYYRVTKIRKFYLASLSTAMVFWYIYLLFNANAIGYGMAGSVPYHF